MNRTDIRARERQVTDIMLGLQLPLHNEGFFYFRDIAVFMNMAPKAKMSDAYRLIAFRHNRTQDQVKSAVRHLINNASDLQARFNTLFESNYVSERPTVKMAFLYMQEYLHLRGKEQAAKRL